jgi:hypothetical protein
MAFISRPATLTKYLINNLPHDFITIEQILAVRNVVVSEPNGFLGHSQSCCPARRHGALFQHERSQH